MKNFWHGLARLFTIPRAVRNRINANPIAPAVKQELATELEASIAGAIAKKVPGVAAQAAISAAISHAIDMTGVLK